MFKRNPNRVAEAALAEKRRRQADLAQRLDGAKAAVATAAAERRRLLIEADQIDGPALSKADAACRTAEDRRDALADALRTIAEQIANTEAQLTTERDVEERARVSADLLPKADTIEALTARFAEAVEPVRDLHADLIEAVNVAGEHGHAIALDVLQAALGAALPSLVFTLNLPREQYPHAVIDPQRRMADLVTDTLRQKAQAVRDGAIQERAA